MKVALDTNGLAYVGGVSGAQRRDTALALIRRLPEGGDGARSGPG